MNSHIEQLGPRPESTPRVQKRGGMLGSVVTRFCLVCALAEPKHYDALAATVLATLNHLPDLRSKPIWRGIRSRRRRRVSRTASAPTFSPGASGRCGVSLTARASIGLVSLDNLSRCPSAVLPYLMGVMGFQTGSLHAVRWFAGTQEKSVASGAASRREQQ